MPPVGQTAKAPRTPREETERLLHQTRVSLAAHEKVLRECIDEQQRRRQGLEKAEAAFATGRAAHRDIFIRPKVVEVGRAFVEYRSALQDLARIEEVIAALKQQIARGNIEHRRLVNKNEKLQGEIKLLEGSLTQYGRLLTLPERPGAAVKRRHANQR